MDTNWVGILDDYTVQVLVLDPHLDGDMLRLFQANPGWRVDFEDDEAVILVRVEDLTPSSDLSTLEINI